MQSSVCQTISYLHIGKFLSNCVNSQNFSSLDISLIGTIINQASLFPKLLNNQHKITQTYSHNYCVYTVLSNYGFFDCGHTKMGLALVTTSHPLAHRPQSFVAFEFWTTSQAGPIRCESEGFFPGGTSRFFQKFF